MATQVNSSDPVMLEKVSKSLLFGIGNILSASSSGAKFDEKEEKSNKDKNENENRNDQKSKVTNIKQLIVSLCFKNYFYISFKPQLIKYK